MIQMPTFEVYHEIEDYPHFPALTLGPRLA